MAYRNYFRALLNDNFKILTWVLILFIAITPNFIFMQSARASTSLGGWTITSQIAQGTSLALTATKTAIINGSNVLKTSTAKITPNAQQVAKILRGGAAGYALSIAVEQLIGAVDWVLDPANNQILYSNPTVKEPTDPTVQYYFVAVDNTKHIDQKDACQIRINQLIADVPTRSYTFLNYQNDASFFRCVYSINHTENPDDTFIVNVSRVANPAYDPTAEEDKKQTLPLDVVGQQVIDNANSGDTTAQQATTAAAQDLLNNDAATQSDVENQLNTNSKTQTSEEAAAEATPKDPAAPEAGTDIKINFPVFCSWAPIVCETAQSALNFMTDFSPDQQTSEVTIQDNNIIFDDSQRLNFSSSCPPPEQFTVSFFGYSQNLEFSYQPLCEFMSMIKFFVIAGSYVIGAYIVMGLSRGSAE